ncbi:MAG: hypothetical protein EBS30_10710, partial [Planctomycetes bacterium]|nr:hypothetical protein [Planctomycetota bacterium]
MFKSLFSLFNMSKVSLSTRTIAKRLRPGLQLLEDRTTPAVLASVVSNVLIINLQAANDSAAITFAAGAYTVSGNINTSPLTSVTSILVRDTGTRATGQAITVTSIGAISGGFTSIGVETVTINDAIGNSSTADGISISAATAININADLTAGDAPIVLGGTVVLNKLTTPVTIDAGDGDVTFGGTVNSFSTTPKALIVSAGNKSVQFNGALGATFPLGAITVSGDTEIQLGGNIT